ncbi:ATP12 chaperone protein [Novymonas esmeraldas]|uniref:ATP12 chaperone protein n=1 Tax=Novymonas esmeraldas TaxID=1808958 RepID=A0AAW0ETH2_9TRYP
MRALASTATAASRRVWMSTAARTTTSSAAAAAAAMTTSRLSVSSSPTAATTAPAGATGPAVAPKKPRRRITSRLDASDLLKKVPSEPGAHAELSTAELERKVEEMSRMNPKQLEEVMRRFETQEEESSRVLSEDALYQMDVSLAPRSSGAVRVFWKDVDVVELSERYPGWFAVAVDGRRVKAFETSQALAVPSMAMACCCAQEYAEQTGHINKLLMPMSDICSGALHIAPQMLTPRIDYLLSFFQNDNLYFRAAPIAAAQDAMIAPIVAWFERVYEMDVPRVVGIGDPHITPHATARMRDALLAMNMNPYQVLALCVTAQFTSSLLLPLALFHGVVDLPTALAINRAEEHHNITEAGLVEGYHDIREADVVTKICACATTWRLMKDVPLAKCLEVPRAAAAAMEEAESV